MSAMAAVFGYSTSRVAVPVGMVGAGYLLFGFLGEAHSVLGVVGAGAIEATLLGAGY